jgi:DNA-binding MarR family transcriptional regulator
LLAAGDALVAPLGLTSARWQVLGAIDMAPAPLPIAHIARNMGLSRQAVRRTVDEMAAEGILAFAPNPHHALAKLVAMTAAGRKLFARAAERQRPWAARLVAGVDASALRDALTALRAPRMKLEKE